MLWGTKNQAGEVRSAMRRLIDGARDFWNSQVPEVDRRQESRLDRVMPALILPDLSGDSNAPAKMLAAFTRNLSAEGVSVLTNEKIATGGVMIVIGESDHRVIMRGECRNSQHIGFGCHQSGVHLREVLPLAEYAPLVQYIEAMELIQ